MIESDQCLVILLVLIIVLTCSNTCYKHYCANHGPFEGFENITKVPITRYNPVHTNKYNYTSPVGDVEYLAKSGEAIGSRGGFLPLQEKGAGYFLAMADENNMVNVDLIGSDPQMVGFNDFGMKTNGISESYLVQGGERIATPGKSDKVISIRGGKVLEELKCPTGDTTRYVKEDGVCILPTDQSSLKKVFDFKSMSMWQKRKHE